MKIFSPPENITSEGPHKNRRTQAKSKTHARHHAPIEKAQISDREIREKLAAHVETSNSAKSQVIKQNSQAFGAGFMNPDAHPIIQKEATPAKEKESESEEGKSVKESHLLMSDVQLNDPKDSNTQEKLKAALRNGAFSFNAKEKDALEKILGAS